VLHLSLNDSEAAQAEQGSELPAGPGPGPGTARAGGAGIASECGCGCGCGPAGGAGRTSRRSLSWSLRLLARFLATWPCATPARAAGSDSERIEQRPSANRTITILRSMLNNMYNIDKYCVTLSVCTILAVIH
jgi:hypothetical protein